MCMCHDDWMKGARDDALAGTDVINHLLDGIEHIDNLLTRIMRGDTILIDIMGYIANIVFDRHGLVIEAWQDHGGITIDRRAARARGKRQRAWDWAPYREDAGKRSHAVLQARDTGAPYECMTIRQIEHTARDDVMLRLECRRYPGRPLSTDSLDDPGSKSVAEIRGQTPIGAYHEGPTPLIFMGNGS